MDESVVVKTISPLVMGDGDVKMEILVDVDVNASEKDAIYQPYSVNYDELNVPVKLGEINSLIVKLVQNVMVETTEATKSVNRVVKDVSVIIN